VTAGSGDNSNVGGLVGCSENGTIEDSYARGAVSGTGTGLNKGGVIGNKAASCTVSDCYYDTRDTGMSEGSGNATGSATTGLTADKMTGTAASSNMSGLDYTATWTTKANDSKWYFPQLAVFSGSTDEALKAASLKSVTLIPFTVTFDSGSGSAVASEYGYYTAVSEPTAPTRDGYLFEGWFTDSGLTVAYDFSTAVTANITLHAKWTVTVTAESSNTAYGSVSGGGRYVSDTSVTLTATPKTGYYFTGWYNGDTLVSSDATYKFTATKAITLTAKFATCIIVNATSGNAAYGSVSGGGSYTPGTSVTLTASPGKGCYFAGWYNGTALVFASASYTFSAATDITLTAQFDKIGIPGTITASSSEFNKITVSWGPVTGAKGYYMYRATSETGTYKKIGSTTKTSYVNSGVTTGTTYYYKVAAYTKAYTGKFYSAVASAASQLGQVTKVTVSSSYPTKAIINWKAVPGATKYQVLRSDTKDGTYIAVKTTSSKTITDTGLLPGNTYYYKVKALRGTAYGPDSNIVYVTTKTTK
jgi:uncharacterized repeat protein (TIGR02543 family)